MNYPQVIVTVRNDGSADWNIADNESDLAALAYRMANEDWDWAEAPTESDYAEAIDHDMSRTYYIDSQATAQELLAKQPPLPPKTATAVEEACEMMDW